MRDWKGFFVRAGVGALLVAALFAALTLWPEPRSETGGGELWTCSMHPQVRLPAPGPCPICGMNLVPVSQLASERDVLESRAGVRTEPIRARELAKEIRTVGRLDYNERRVKEIAARVAGRVDRVYADFTGLEVRRDDHLVDLYSPDLYTAQRELFLALDAAALERRDASTAQLSLEAARTKLRLWGLLPDQIAEIESSRQMRTHVTIHAPTGGVVVEKSIREGQYVREGDPLYRIAELDPIWLYLNLYEYDVAWVRRGQSVEATLEAFPGDVFEGVVTFVEPFLDDPTRTVRVRVNLRNADRRLKPAMYATASIRAAVLADGSPAPTGLAGRHVCPMHPEAIQVNPGACPFCGMALERIPEAPSNGALPDRKALAVPVSAVLDTGRRRVVYRRTAEGAYELAEVKLGARADGADDRGRRTSYYPVLAGLREGDEVVVRGGFLLDSQRQIEGMPSLFFPEGRSGAGLHAGHGGH